MSQQLTYLTEISGACRSTFWLTQAEIAEKAIQAPRGSWVFVNDQLVNPSDLATMNLEAGSIVRFMPGLIGGPKRYNVEIFDGVSTKEEHLTFDELKKNGYRLLVDGKLVEYLPGEVTGADHTDHFRIELRSDLVDVIVGPASTMVMRRSEVEQITRQFEGPLLAVMGSTVLRNGDITTLLDGTGELFEDLWTNAGEPLVLVATKC